VCPPRAWRWIAGFLGGTKVAGGDANQMADYLDALGATGKRIPTGSRTAFREPARTRPTAARA
jgi:hypothetical protein